MCLPEALSVSGVTRCGTAQARQIREGECTKESIRNSPLQNPARKGMARLRGPKRNWLFLAGGFKRMSGAHCNPHPIAKEEASGLLVGKHLCQAPSRPSFLGQGPKSKMYSLKDFSIRKHPCNQTMTMLQSVPALQMLASCLLPACTLSEA